MKNTIGAIGLAVTLVLSGPAAAQHGHGAKPVMVENAYARASLGAAKNSAAYMTVKNMGDSGDRIVGVRADVAEKAELHNVVKDGDVMRMREQHDGIAVPAGQSIELKPGGFHIMLIGLRAPLKAGDTFPLTLIFAEAGEITLSVPVRSIRAGGMGHRGHGGMDMDHGEMPSGHKGMNMNGK